MKALIGITGNFDGGKVILADAYYKAIQAGGGLPVLLCDHPQEEIAQLAGLLDGLLLSGGDDVDPFLFGEEPVPGLGAVDPKRDAFEIAITRAFRERGKPILGICRGIQLLNVALGGTLVQDLRSQWQDQLLKHSQQSPSDHASHGIRISNDTVLSSIFCGAEQIRVNSFHHQSVKQAADGLRVSAYAGDGVIEAIEDQEGMVLGVQWHAERMWEKHSDMLELFKFFVCKCAKAREEYYNKG